MRYDAKCNIARAHIGHQGRIDGCMLLDTIGE